MMPSGTVTFLFTDIEGSTSLWQKYPATMPEALARHHALLNQSIRANNGYVFQIIGDAFCAAFPTAPDGLEAALAAQRSLMSEAWGETGPIRVRMALHTGAAELHAGDYTSGEYLSGITLSRAARLLSAGHGGQVLLSSPTAELVREQLPPQTSLRDMGAHRLKDLVQPQQIYEVIASDLPAGFPPLKTLDAQPNNLPIQLTSFIGRENEIKELGDLFTRARLLTLTGSGGAGKTRLSLQFAADIIETFANGAWFIDLAPLSDASLLPISIMNSLGLRDDSGRAPLDALTDFLRTKDMLLILDNCEHLVEACAHVAHQLLTHAFKLKILATSREALGIPGEVAYPVPPLALPDPRNLPTVESFSQYDAVRLFIERATAVQPSFAVNNANAPAIAQICYRLDGIPLAIELAAARIKMFSPEQIAKRLDDRFRLLTGGGRTVLPRQQTLRAAIDWSYSLLTEQDRILFRRLAVFAGGWTFEAAEQVCSGDRLDALQVLDGLGQLVNKSLVTTQAGEGEARYRMLETVREYANEKLRAASEMEVLCLRHLDFYLSFAEQAEPQLKRSDQLEWVERLDADIDNFRTALSHAATEGQVEKGLRLGAAIFRLWDMQANWRELVDQLENLLQKPQGAAKTMARANALCITANLESFLGAGEACNRNYRECIDIARSHGERGKRLLAQALSWYPENEFSDNLEMWDALVNEGLELARTLDDDWLIGMALFMKGHTFTRTYRKDYKGGRQLYEASAAHFGAHGDHYWADIASYQASITYFMEGDYGRARQGIEPTLPLLRQHKHRDMVALKLHTLGEIARSENNYALARLHLTEAFELAQEIGLISVSRNACSGLGYVALHDGDLVSARVFFGKWRELTKDSINPSIIAFKVVQVASLAAAEKKPWLSIRLFGFGHDFYAERGKEYLDPIEQTEIDRYLAIARSEVSESEFDAAWRAGCALTLEQAIKLALSEG